VTVLAKCEFMNPASSVKDRLGIALLRAAKESGQLKEGGVIADATSGNTGIALAMAAAAEGYKCVIVMAEQFSLERRLVMRGLGAQVVLTPAADAAMGMFAKLRELCDEHGYVNARQFESEANERYHAMTTAPEILLDTADAPPTHLVLSYGTGGTAHGVARVMRAAYGENKPLSIKLAEPEEAPMVTSGLPQERDATSGFATAPHPAWKKHAVQGWAPQTIPAVLQRGIDAGYFDGTVTVTDAESIAMARQLAHTQGIFTGISGGGAVAATLKEAATAPAGSVLLTVIADGGDRYLSTPLFEGVTTEMNEEELAISKSTPSHQIPQ
jgi:cysteine synthase A